MEFEAWLLDNAKAAGGSKRVARDGAFDLRGWRWHTMPIRSGLAGARRASDDAREEAKEEPLCEP